MNENIIVCYKKVGETPLDLIKRIKRENPVHKETKMAYAGRLDPMAEGLVLLIAKEELKNFDSYLTLDKEYRAEVLFGVSTDTYDLLGLAKKEDAFTNEEFAKREIQKMEGIFKFSLPPYSSYKIKKKPLFFWAKQNRLDEIDIPERESNIYNIKVNNSHFIKKEDLQKEIEEKIGLVDGDFRQEEILKRWNIILKEIKEDLLIVDFSISCSSGCYVRSIAEELGRRVKSGAVLYSLKRERVGDYSLEDIVS